MCKGGGLLDGDVATVEGSLSASLYGDLVECAYVLSREDESGRAVLAVDTGSEGSGYFFWIGRADYVKVWNDAETGSGLYRLVGWSVFSDAYGVVS